MLDVEFEVDSRFVRLRLISCMTEWTRGWGEVEGLIGWSGVVAGLFVVREKRKLL